MKASFQQAFGKTKKTALRTVFSGFGGERGYETYSPIS
jgi:hypothetical protein